MLLNSYVIFSITRWSLGLCHCEGVKSTVVKPSKLSLVKKYSRLSYRQYDQRLSVVIDGIEFGEENVNTSFDR